jgi:hypothetical protein
MLYFMKTLGNETARFRDLGYAWTDVFSRQLLKQRRLRFYFLFSSISQVYSNSQGKLHISSDFLVEVLEEHVGVYRPPWNPSAACSQDSNPLSSIYLTIYVAFFGRSLHQLTDAGKPMD